MLPEWQFGNVESGTANQFFSEDTPTLGRRKKGLYSTTGLIGLYDIII
jgi:hypothetical protein